MSFRLILNLLVAISLSSVLIGPVFAQQDDNSKHKITQAEKIKKIEAKMAKKEAKLKALKDKLKVEKSRAASSPAQ